MTKTLLLILLTFTTIIFAAEENINILFSKDSTKYWQYSSDKTMGGISNGQATLEQDGEIFFLRLAGNVSTKNNGGFIQLRSTISLINSEKNDNKIKGVRLNVRGNGENYYIFMRTNETQSYSDYYSASFETNSNWKMVDLPLDKFERKRSNKSTLDAKNIRSISIVAYGRDFISDVSISKIIFYY
jgi:hypothetical protein